jgi:hypothetical protein
VLETGYGGEAVTRIGRVEARLTLASWNPPLVLEDAVYFGMYFQDASDPNNIAGIQLELEQEGIFSYSQVTSEGVTGFNQRQVNLNTFEIGMERSTQNGAVVVFVNGGQVGPPIPFLEPDAPVLPVLYVHDGDVIVHVETYRITLR